MVNDGGPMAERAEMIHAVAAGWLRRRAHRGATVLQRRGAWPPPDAPRVAVVGTRQPTAQQLAFAHGLTQGLIGAGCSVWSGGAIGVDAAVHHAALGARGHTVAVLPGGLVPPTPVGHTALFEAIVAGGGGVLACDANGVVGRSAYYLRRNAVLVAGVDAVVIVAGDLRSGTMNTAGWAGRTGVPLAAVPWGPSTPNSGGCLALLATGAARMVCSAADVLDWLQVDAAPGRWQRYAPGPGPRGDLSPAVQALLDELAAAGDRGLSLEDLCRTGRERDSTAALLLDLTLDGAASRDRWGRYHRRGTTAPSATTES